MIEVKGTFLNLDDGQSLMKRYRKIRKAKTDFALEVGIEWKGERGGGRKLYIIEFYRIICGFSS